MSTGRAFHCLAHSTEKYFAKELVLANGTLSSSLSTDRKLLLCIFDGLVNQFVKYSGVGPFNVFKQINEYAIAIV